MYEIIFVKVIDSRAVEGRKRVRGGVKRPSQHGRPLLMIKLSDGDARFGVQAKSGKKEINLTQGFRV